MKTVALWIRFCLVLIHMNRLPQDYFQAFKHPVMRFSWGDNVEAIGRMYLPYYFSMFYAKYKLGLNFTKAFSLRFYI